MNPGTRLGAYQIVNSLGAGGMGEVYRAHDPRLGRDVALKVLPAEMASDPSRLERFTREARAIAALNHPHIVTIYSTEEADGVRFLTMELVEGQALDALIPASGMPLARFLELAVPLADALNAAHQKQITHRDLKPANVMVADDGRVKVLDFGLASAPNVAPSAPNVASNGARDVARDVARDFSPAEKINPADLVTSPQVTTPGTIIGTMPYMSPEQIEGKQLDHRTDLFSLGVMFHEMLAGTRPFTGASSPQLMSSILRDTPSSTSELRAEVPDALSRLIIRCLEKNPDDRVQTARDIYNELRLVQKQLESGTRRKPDGGSARAGDDDSLWLAVLPFTTRGADTDSVSLAAGLTEDVTAGLALFPSLSVVALQSARSFKDSALDVRQIAERLNARYVMGGSVRKSASGIRVAAQLIDARSGAQLWTETYDRGAGETDIYAVQDDITDRIVSTVADKAGVLARSLVQATRGYRTDQLGARQLVHRCWGWTLRPTPHEHVELRAAIEAFVERRPDEAALWAELAHLYIAEYSLFFNPLPDSIRRAARAARRAIELEPSNQEGWVSLGLASFHNHDEPGLLEAADRVLKLNPRNSNAVAWIGALFGHKGDYDRGCALVERAMALNSAHPGWYHFTLFDRHFARGEFNEALRAARRVNIPDFMWMHFAIASAAGHLGLAADGRAAIEAMETLAPALAEEGTLREFVTRWYWDDDVIESLLDGVRRSKNAAPAAEAPPVRSRTRSSSSGASPAPRPPSSAAIAASTSDGADVPPHAQPKGLRTGVTTPSSDTRPASDVRSGVIDMSVTVRPFAVRGGDSETPELAEGLKERIATGLSRFTYLRLRTSSVAADTARTGRDTPDEPARARFVIEGGVTRSGRALRINVRLLEMASGTTLWAEQYDRDLSADTFTIQDDVGDRVIATLADDGGVLYRLFADAVRASTSEELTALRLFVRFAEFVEQFSLEEHARLRDEFEVLVQSHPANATAWAQLAVLYGQEVLFDFNRRPDSIARMRRAAERAVALDSTNQTAWYALADAAFLQRNASAFRSAADRAIELNPLRSRAVGAVGLLRAFAGDAAAGAALVARAIALNPRHPGWFHIALFLDAFQRGDADRALGEAARINQPGIPVDGRLFAIAAAGRFDRVADAAPALDALRRDHPHLLDAHRAREAWAHRIWNAELVDNLVDGFAKALIAAGVPGPPVASPAQPVSSASSSSAAVRAAPQGMRVAVLPFSARQGDDPAASLAAGLTDDITAGLSRFSYLRVVARDQVEARVREGLTRSPLDARYVLEGSVRTAGQSVRVSARLVDVESGAHLWAENFDHDLGGGPFAVQDDVSGKIASRVADPSGVLVRSMVAELGDKADASATVFDLTLQYFAHLETFTPEQHARLRDGLEQALEREPNDATGWAVLADLYGQERALGHNPRPDPIGRQQRAAERAIAIDATCQYGWVHLAAAHYLRGDLAAFHHEAGRAIALNPLNTHVLTFLGAAVALAGSWDRGARLIQQALELNPNVPGHAHLIPFLDAYRRGEDIAALAAAKKISVPGLHNGHFARAAAGGQLQRRDEAQTALDDLRRVKPEMLDPAAARAMLTGWLQDTALVDRLVEGLQKALALTAPPAEEKSPASWRDAVHQRLPRTRLRQRIAQAIQDAGTRREASRPAPSIAVLPFADLSAANDQGWFCDGIAEEILDALAQLPGLRVAARTSAFSFRDRDDAAKAIAETLGVGTVLEGSVRRAGDRVRITVQLVDPGNGFQLWSERYDRELKDIFAIQEEIARSVAARLQISLGSVAGKPLVAAQQASFQAYERYLKARALLIRRGPSILPALEELREVVALAPDFAPAWSAIAEAYSVGTYSGLIPAADARRDGLSAARRAMALAPESADSYAAIAGLRFLCQNDRSGALDAHRRALELNPFHVQNRCWYALFLQRAYGRLDEGVAEARRVLEIDPLSAYVTMVLGTTLVTAGRAEEGAALGRRAVEIDPQSFHAHWALGVALTYSGQLEEAGRVLEQTAKMSGRHHFAVTSLAINHARQGRSDLAQQLHRELLDRAASGSVPSTQLILTADAAGDRDEAIAHAERALADREPPLVMLARHFPDFQDLRQDPRFVAILRQMEAPWPPPGEEESGPR